MHKDVYERFLGKHWGTAFIDWESCGSFWRDQLGIYQLIGKYTYERTREERYQEEY
jgi:hypothetical protein